MVRLDIPEMLILFLLAAAGAWAVYNWTHPEVHSPKGRG
jgi:hypothetical protein